MVFMHRVISQLAYVHVHINKLKFHGYCKTIDS